MGAADVLVTGTSMLCSLGVGSEAVWQALLAQKRTSGERSYVMRDGVTLRYPVYPMQPLALEDWLDRATYLALVEEGLDQDWDFVALVAAARLALADAKLKLEAGDAVGLVIGHENAGVVPLMDRLLADREVDGDPNVKHDALASFRRHQEAFFRIQTFTYPFYLAKALQVTGPAYITNNACATGLYALEQGRQLIISGQVEAVVVVCSDYAHVTEHLWLSQKGLLSPTYELRPFDRRRNGSVLGDAAAAFVLESSSHAARRLARPLCVYKGSRFRQDNWQITLPDVTAHGYSAAIGDAVSKTADSRQPDLLIPHGTGSPLWDQYEAVEIRRAFAALSREVPPVTAFKSAVGHTLGACSLLESALAVQCLLHQLIPPIVDYAEEDPKVALPIVQTSKEQRLRSVLKTVSAYGGFHAAAVFAELDEENRG